MDRCMTPPYQIPHETLHCKSTWLETAKLWPNSMAKILVLTRLKFHMSDFLDYEAHFPNMVSTIHIVHAQLQCCFLHSILSQYLINPQTPLIISSRFFIALNLQGFGSPSCNITLLFSFYFKSKYLQVDSNWTWCNEVCIVSRECSHY